MKKILVCLFAVAVIMDGAMLTSTICTASTDFGMTQLFSAAQTDYCRGSDLSPSFPELLGYRVSAEAHLGGPGESSVRTFTQSGPWESLAWSKLTTVSASARTLYDDVLLFSGAGLATLRLTVSASASPDISGVAKFTINGATQQFYGTGTSLHILDFTIPLGTPLNFSAETITASFVNDATGVRDSNLSISTRYALYNADGNPFITTYSAHNGYYDLQLTPDNGPMISRSDPATQPAEAPEPGTLGLLLVGLAVCVLRISNISPLRAILRRRSFSDGTL